MNPFAPYASILGLAILSGSEVVDGDRTFTEVDGCDYWLVQEPSEVAQGLFRHYVVNAEGQQVTEAKFNPGYAVRDLAEMLG